MKLTIPVALLAVLLAGCGARHRERAAPVHTLRLTTNVSPPVLTTCAEAGQARGSASSARRSCRPTA